ncbi:MAG TPA: cyclic nucleotide-binding domain-containing protein [Candidatus Dormibacteraeota bacterium]
MAAVISRQSLLLFVARLFRVRRSEMARVGRMTSLAVVLGWGMYCAFNATQAIFLVQSGPEAYPLFFILLALTVWPAVALQGALVRRFGVGRAFRYQLLANAVIPVTFYLIYRAYETQFGVAFALYIGYSVAFELVMLLFWSFVSQHFNLLEGKRIFPVIAAGSSVGYILAGVTTSLVSPVAGTESLMFFWSLGAGMAGLIVYISERRLYRPAVEDEADEFLVETQRRRHSGRLFALVDALRYLRKSSLVLAFVVMAGLLVVTMRVSDYLVAVVFVNVTHRRLNDLSVLIGNAWLISYFVQLVLALWVTPLLLNRAGVKNVILALPAAAVAGFVAVALAPGLNAAIFLFVIRNGLQTGVDDPAQQILGSALPAQVAPKLKLLLDDFTLPGAAILAGLFCGALGVIAPQADLVVLLAVAGAPLGLCFLAAAWWMRGHYVNAVYDRLRTHAISLNDLVQAIGRPNPAQIRELRSHLADPDAQVRQFAAAGLGRLAPESFRALVPQLATSPDPMLRRMAFQMARPGAITREMCEAAEQDRDPWVVAAAAVAGFKLHPPWPRSVALLGKLDRSKVPETRAAGVWAAAFVVDEKLVLTAMEDPSPRVRLEAVRSFAKLKGALPGAADPLVHLIGDRNLEVRREALEQCIRWAPPPGRAELFEEALINALTTGDRSTRRLAAQAMAVQAPNALERALPHLEKSATETAVATMEALVRCGIPRLVQQAQDHLEGRFERAEGAARLAARLRGMARLAGGGEDARFMVLRHALDDYVRQTIEVSLGAMRALHSKRGFTTVERGLKSEAAQARIEALETLLNFGPGWLAGPLVRLLDAEAYDEGGGRLPSSQELEDLKEHPDHWVRLAASAVERGEVEEDLKDLIALKKVPLFAQLSLEQLSSIDRLMVTRHYLKGEHIFENGDLGSELFIVLDGEIRIHRDQPGREVTLGRIEASGYFGEMAVFEDLPRSAGAMAAADSTLRVLRKDRFNAIVHEHPEVMLEVIKYLSQRLRMANEQLGLAARTAEPAQPVGARA